MFRKVQSVAVLIFLTGGVSCHKHPDFSISRLKDSDNSATPEERELASDLTQAVDSFVGGESEKLQFIALANQRKVSWRAAAESGDPKGQFRWGLYQLVDLSGRPSAEEALLLFKMSANQGLAESQSMLGTCYQLGMGVSLDPVQAIARFEKAAGQGYV